MVHMERGGGWTRGGARGDRGNKPKKPRPKKSSSSKMKMNPVGVLVAENQSGVVKWFSDKKGFGFIGRKKGDDDIFVHFSDISGEGFRTLSEGDMVLFDIERTKKGLGAKNVRTVS